MDLTVILEGMEWSRVGVLQSIFWAQSTGFHYVHCSSFLFMYRDCGNCLAGELTQLQDPDWEETLVALAVSSPINSCVVLQGLELQTYFLLHVHKSCELCPGCVATDMREGK